MAYNTWEAIYTSVDYYLESAWLAHLIKAEVNLTLTGIRVRGPNTLLGGFEVWSVAGALGSKTFDTRILDETAGSIIDSGAPPFPYYLQLTGISVNLSAGQEFALVVHMTAGGIYYTGANYRSTAEFTTISSAGGVDNYYVSSTRPANGTAISQQPSVTCFEIYYEAAAPVGRPRRWVCII